MYVSTYGWKHTYTLRKEGKFYVRNSWWEIKYHGPDVRTASHKTARGWQKVKGKCLPGRKNALWNIKALLLRGAIFMLCWQDGYSFTSLKGPTKGLVCLNLAGTAGPVAFIPFRSFTDMTPPCLPSQTSRLGWLLLGPGQGAEVSSFALGGAAIWSWNPAEVETQSLPLPESPSSTLPLCPVVSQVGCRPPQVQMIHKGAQWNNSDAIYINVHLTSFCVHFVAHNMLVQVNRLQINACFYWGKT